MIVKIDPEIIPFGEYVQDFCKNPYPLHSKGCPNYGKKQGCPPCSLIDKELDFKRDLYLIYTEFKIGEFAERMKEKYPHWTEKQTYNCRLWQPRARKEHNLEIEKAKKEYSIDVIKSPEAKGVNVNLLMAKIGIKLEWPPRKITRVVSIGGYKK